MMSSGYISISVILNRMNGKDSFIEIFINLIELLCKQEKSGGRLISAGVFYDKLQCYSFQFLSCKY